MVASFPGSIKTWSLLVDGVDQAEAAQINSVYDEVTAIEAYVEVNGWLAGGSWTYASAVTITIPAGGLDKYAVGDKIKLTQARSQAFTNDPAAGSNIELNMADTTGFNVGNKVLVSSSAGSEVAIITVVHANTHITVDVLALNHTTTNRVVYIGTTTTGIKYFYVVAVADTLLTICGGSDYSLENAAISLNYYSHATSPVSFPGYFNWIPTIVGWTATPVTKARFNLVGRMMTLKVIQSNSASNDTVITLTAPVAAAYDCGGVIRWLMDNGATLTTPGRVNISAGSTTINAYKDCGFGAWTNSGNKAVVFDLVVEI